MRALTTSTRAALAQHPWAAEQWQRHLSGKTESSFELVLDLILDGLVRLNA